MYLPLLSKLRHSERSEESNAVEILRPPLNQWRPQNDKFGFISQKVNADGYAAFNLDTHVYLLQYKGGIF